MTNMDDGFSLDEDSNEGNFFDERSIFDDTDDSAFDYDDHGADEF